jgi:outer membrane biosynthesis protein TonB
MVDRYNRLRMRRLPNIVLLMLASLAAHVVALATAAAWMSGAAESEPSIHRAADDAPIIVRIEPPVAPLPPPLPEPTPPVALPPPEPEPQPEPVRLGERDGTGDALSTLDAEQVLQARQADMDQALVRVEPMPALPEPSPPEPTPPEQESRPALPELMPTVRGVETPIDSLDAPSPGEAGSSDEPSARNDERVQERVEPIETTTATPTPQAPSTPTTSAEPDPASASYTDSDPFSTKLAAEFQSGRTNARGGRAFSVRRPRIDLGFRADATRLGTPIACTFRVVIDSAGHPTIVEVVRSSGSERIDQATRLALFEAWFDPANGPKSFNFAIIYR